MASPQGVEAIIKLVDVFIDIYPKPEIATSLLDYARTDGLPSSEKLYGEDFCRFKVMGKSDELMRLRKRFQAFDSDLKATHLLMTIRI